MVFLIPNSRNMDFKEAVNSKPVVLVEFFATWCPHCKRMMPVVEEVKELLEGSVDIYQLDIDLNEALAEKEGVNVVLHLSYIRMGRRNGVIVERFPAGLFLQSCNHNTFCRTKFLI